MLLMKTGVMYFKNFNYLDEPELAKKSIRQKNVFKARVFLYFLKLVLRDIFAICSHLEHEIQEKLTDQLFDGDNSQC